MPDDKLTAAIKAAQKLAKTSVSATVSPANAKPPGKVQGTDGHPRKCLFYQFITFTDLLPCRIYPPTLSKQ